jgi:drug/metabolite transporter (DMT)-like permease
MPTLAIIFATVFVVGPLSYLWLLRPRPSRKQFVGIGCIVAGSTGMSIVLRYLSGGWGQDVWVTLTGIALIWIAWIAILVFVAQKFRQQDARQVVRRWTSVIGALATTIPWFGLASARMMTF